MRDRLAYIGVDLGGTNLRAALVDCSGKILHSTKTLVGIEQGAKAAAEKLLHQCRNLLESAMDLGVAVHAVGLAVAGKIDKTAGAVLFSPNLPALNGYALGLELRERLQLPVYMENDANAMGLGESWCGTAKGMKNWVGIILGTGTGGCLFLDGRLWEGEGLGFSAEVGHMIIQPGGPPCPCGSKGCLEAFASARALVSGAKRAISQKSLTKGPLYRMTAHGRPEAHSIFACALEGDTAAKGLFVKMGWALGIALSNLFTVLGIRHAVIAGGVSAAWDLFIGPLKKTLAQNLSMLDPSLAVILRSSLGDDAALIGAGRLAELESQRAEAG
ncbi:MAG: ROK family protein [Syntrophobacteraceae bacterium]